ncbi:MAG: hypothetical protein AB7G75_29880 [Candidatus Binatia bacterium]
MEKLEIRTANRQKLVVQFIPSKGLVLDILTPQNTEHGHGWTVSEQVILDSAYVTLLQMYLEEHSL